MFEIVRKCSKMFGNIRKCSKMFENVRQPILYLLHPHADIVRKCSKMFENVRKCSTMFENVRKCSTMFENVRQCSTDFWRQINVMRFIYCWRQIEMSCNVFIIPSDHFTCKGLPLASYCDYHKKNGGSWKMLLYWITCSVMKTNFGHYKVGTSPTTKQSWCCLIKSQISCLLGILYTATITKCTLRDRIFDD